MRRFGFGFLLLTTLLTQACGSGTPAAPPMVTAKGTVGEEDTPDVSIRQVTLKAGETLIVSCNDEGGDVGITWKDTPLHMDVVKQGGGFYTALYSLYSATGGTGDIVASHGSAGDLGINAYAVTHLAPSAALDKTAAAMGEGTSPSSGAATTTKANEFLFGTIGYAAASKASGTWNDGFMSGAQYTDTNGIGGVEDGYKTVSSTGPYTAAKTGVDKGNWTALIATYATGP